MVALVHLLGVAALLQQGPPAAPDAAELRRLARSTEAEYERRIRRYAPVGSGGVARDRCDEIVGRFCLFFEDDEEERPIAPDHEAIVAARQATVQALRRAFSADPARLDVGAPLVRYLVEDDRATEAAAAARTLAWASPDTAHARLVLGFALHYAGEAAAADSAFRDGLAALPPREREEALDLQWLLEHDERDRYEDLDPADRRRYEDRLWTLADPLFLEPGNPALAEHLARRVWARLLPEAPWVRGSISWGRDLEQLTMRYGVPVAKERIAGTLPSDFQFVERYDPAQVRLVPGALLSGADLERGLPGEASPLDPERPRSAHVPGSLARLLDLPHQLVRYPSGPGALLRAHAGFVLDSLSADADSLLGGLFILDRESLETLTVSLATVEVPADAAAGDTLDLLLETRLPAGRFVYSVEVLEPVSRVAARGRFNIDVDQPQPPFTVSDVVVARPFGRGRLPRSRDAPALRPLSALELDPGEALGIYAEVVRPGGPRGTARYRVDLRVERLDSPSAPVRALRWLGRKLGLVDERRTPHVVWEVDAEPDGTTPIALDLDAAGLGPGLYAARIGITDASGARRERSRPFRVGER